MGRGSIQPGQWGQGQWKRIRSEGGSGVGGPESGWRLQLRVTNSTGNPCPHTVTPPEPGTRPGPCWSLPPGR